MSVEAITWALRQPVPKSSAKFVLVVLANSSHKETGFAFPSVAYIAEATGQDRKTVLANLRRLVDDGFIEDTGERRGKTRQVVVYRLRVEVQRDGDLLTERHYCYRSEDPTTGRYYIGVRSCLGEPSSDAGYVGSGRWVQSLAAMGAIPTKTVLSVFASRLQAEDAERELIAASISDTLCMNRVVPPKRTEIGMLPKSTDFGPVIRVPNSPEKCQKQSQKRDTEPVGNRKEPEKQEKRASAPPLSKPDGVEEGTWTDWLALRKAKRAPVTQTVVTHAITEAAKAGLTLESFLRVWCARGSQGLEADWLKPNERGDVARGARPGKQVQGVMALEELKNAARERQRLAAGGDCDGAAEAHRALAGPDSCR